MKEWWLAGIAGREKQGVEVQWEDEKVYQLSGYIYLFIFDVCDILLRMYEINLLRDGRYHVFWSRDWSLYLL